MRFSLKQLWWRGREGKCLLRSISKAKRFQRHGNDAAMRRVLTAADFAVEAIQRDELSFAKNWQTLLRFQLAVFDLHGAEKTVRRAKAPVTNEVMEIVTQTAAWEGALDAARASMREGWEPSSSKDRLLIFLPSTAMGLETTQQPGLRTGLRIIFGEILATCHAEGIPVEIRGRLANHGTPPDETGRRYISHHTRSQRDGGLHIKVTDLPGCFSIDERGYSGWSKFSQTPLEKLNLPEVDLKKAEKFVCDLRQRIIVGNVSKYQQTAIDAGIRLPETYVFLALQVIDDAVQALAHLPMLEMLAEVAETCRMRNLALVVKRHPRCNSSEVTKALAEGNFQLSEASIHDLISRSSAVCVVNSSVGAEALLHGKPVYVFGQSEYQHVCFRMREKGDFEKHFKPDEMPVSRDDLSRFLYLLRNEYAVDTNDLPSARPSIRRRILGHVGRKI